MAMATLDSVLEGRRSQPSQLVEVLQDIQDLYGYVSEEAMEKVANNLGVPLMEVYRVACFYKAFSLQPKGKNVITICTGTACHVRGSDLLIDQAKGQLQIEAGETTGDGLFTFECVNCLGACALGPIVVHNSVYNPHVTPGKLRKMIDKAEEVEQKEAAHGKTE